MDRLCYTAPMDALEQGDIHIARTTDPGEKLAQALRMMATGLRMKRAGLVREFPDASEDEIERRFVAWLLQDD